MGCSPLALNVYFTVNTRWIRSSLVHPVITMYTPIWLPINWEFKSSRDPRKWDFGLLFTGVFHIQQGELESVGFIKRGYESAFGWENWKLQSAVCSLCHLETWGVNNYYCFNDQGLVSSPTAIRRWCDVKFKIPNYRDIYHPKPWWIQYNSNICKTHLWLVHDIPTRSQLSCGSDRLESTS